MQKRGRQVLWAQRKDRAVALISGAFQQILATGIVPQARARAKEALTAVAFEKIQPGWTSTHPLHPAEGRPIRTGTVVIGALHIHVVSRRDIDTAQIFTGPRKTGKVFRAFLGLPKDVWRYSEFHGHLSCGVFGMGGVASRGDVFVCNGMDLKRFQRNEGRPFRFGSPL